MLLLLLLLSLPLLLILLYLSLIDSFSQCRYSFQVNIAIIVSFVNFLIYTLSRCFYLFTLEVKVFLMCLFLVYVILYGNLFYTILKRFHLSFWVILQFFLSCKYIYIYIYIYIYNAYLASVRFEHSLCHESLMTTYMLLALFVKYALVHWYQNRTSCAQVQELLQSHAIVVITERAHFFPWLHVDITLIWLCEIWALFVSWTAYDHLYYAFCLLSTLWFIVTRTIHHVPKCMSCHKASKR